MEYRRVNMESGKSGDGRSSSYQQDDLDGFDALPQVYTVIATDPLIFCCNPAFAFSSWFDGRFAAA